MRLSEAMVAQHQTEINDIRLLSWAYSALRRPALCTSCLPLPAPLLEEVSCTGRYLFSHLPLSACHCLFLPALSVKAGWSHTLLHYSYSLSSLHTLHLFFHTPLRPHTTPHLGLPSWKAALCTSGRHSLHLTLGRLTTCTPAWEEEAPLHSCTSGGPATPFGREGRSLCILT